MSKIIGIDLGTTNSCVAGSYSERRGRKDYTVGSGILKDR